MDAVASGGESQTVGVDAGSELVRVRLDRQQTPGRIAVIAPRPDVMDVDPVGTDPLYASVATDALDAFAGVRHWTDRCARVTVTHEGHRISVSSDDEVTIFKGDERSTEHDRRDTGR